ncbi:hypothetical protein KIN20_030575, partial [Parelaphostrongylus tenuis]
MIESYCEPKNVEEDVGAAETRRTIRNSSKHEKSKRREGSRQNKVVEKLQQSGSGCKEPNDVSGKSFGVFYTLMV